MTLLLQIILTLAMLLALAILLIYIAVAQSKAAVRERVFALPYLTDAEKVAVWECFEEAELADPLWRKLRDKLLAPVVLLVPLLFLPRAADALPKWLSYWADRTSINGDGQAVLRDGRFLTFGADIPWGSQQPGERIYSYSDLDYTGDAYYARGHHPRSWFARLVWLGFRNVATQRDVDAGAMVWERPIVVAGSEPRDSGGTPIASTAQPGWMLLSDGVTCYQWHSVDRMGPLVIVRNVGYKLGIVRNSPSGTGRASVIATWFSIKRRRGG